MRRPRILAVGLAAAALAAAAPAGASAAPAIDDTFPTSGSPKHLEVGPDGAVWFTLSGSLDNKEFGRITADGTVTEYDTPNNQAVQGIGLGPDVAGGPLDRIWMTQQTGVVKWNPEAGSGTAFPIADLVGGRGIVADRDGNLWAVGSAGLVKIAPNGSEIDDVPVADASGRGIVLGSDGRMWWADFLGSIRATAVTAPYATQTFAEDVEAPQEIAAGPAGQLAFSDPPAAVGRISVGGAVEATAAPGDATGVTFGNDRAYWFAQFASNSLGRLTSAGDLTQPVSFPAGSGPRDVVAAPGGTLWVSLETSGQIARVSGVEAPAGDTARPAISRVRPGARRVSLRLSEAARVRIRIERRGPKGLAQVRLLRRAGRSGHNVFALKRRLRPGRYRVTAMAVDVAGNRSRPVRRDFGVAR